MKTIKRSRKFCIVDECFRVFPGSQGFASARKCWEWLADACEVTVPKLKKLRPDFRCLKISRGKRHPKHGHRPNTHYGYAAKGKI